MGNKHFITTALSVLLVVWSLLSFYSCTHKTEDIKIAISKAQPSETYAPYISWIQSVDSSMVTIDMSRLSSDSALAILEECSGLLLTGGPDIFPGLYGKTEDTIFCENIDIKRDSLEIALIKKAIELDIPILGICRGEQMINVALGGTLIPDIPGNINTTVAHRLPDTYNCFHTVNIEAGTKLMWASNTMNGKVNSRHHQAIDLLSDKLKTSARSTDGLIEAIEWKEIGNQSFLMGIQWHPEEMDWNDPLSKSILEYFIMEVKGYKINRRYES